MRHGDDYRQQQPQIFTFSPSGAETTFNSSNPPPAPRQPRSSGSTTTALTPPNSPRSPNVALSALESRVKRVVERMDFLDPQMLSAGNRIEILETLAHGNAQKIKQLKENLRNAFPRRVIFGGGGDSSSFESEEDYHYQSRKTTSYTTKTSSTSSSHSSYANNTRELSSFDVVVYLSNANLCKIQTGAFCLPKDFSTSSFLPYLMLCTALLK